MGFRLIPSEIFHIFFSINYLHYLPNCFLLHYYYYHHCRYCYYDYFWCANVFKSLSFSHSSTLFQKLLSFFFYVLVFDSIDVRFLILLISLYSTFLSHSA